MLWLREVQATEVGQDSERGMEKHSLKSLGGERLICNAAGASAQFIFLPGVPIQLGTLLPVLMGADALGALLGWRYLDHLGHLGGAVFGGPFCLPNLPCCRLPSC